ncbi:hypothetical protein [Streptomyces sp. NPDC101165]|uniref:hypothetical protein n=1 Tax=Streptomyces sp. NPDC101165 TaxID=3366119 RepID=UPI003824C3F8
MRTAAHPVFALAVMGNRPVFRARTELADGLGLPELTAAVDDTEAVVLQVVSERLALVMVTTQGAETLARAGFTVDDTAAFPIRDDKPVSAAETLADAPRRAPSGWAHAGPDGRVICSRQDPDIHDIECVT